MLILVNLNLASNRRKRCPKNILGLVQELVRTKIKKTRESITSVDDLALIWASFANIVIIAGLLLLHYYS